jgi:hypothetical protein
MELDFYSTVTSIPEYLANFSEKKWSRGRMCYRDSSTRFLTFFYESTPYGSIILTLNFVIENSVSNLRRYIFKFKADLDHYYTNGDPKKCFRS